MLLYISTHLHAGRESLQSYTMDLATGALVHQSTLTNLSRPTFIIRHPTLPMLYAVSEESGEGRVVAVPLHSTDGSLLQNPKKIEMLSSEGKAPCHLSINATGTLLCVANYLSGTFATILLSETGGFVSVGDLFSFTGVGIHATRQRSSHIHASVFSPHERYVLITDLGLDRLVRFQSTADHHPKLLIDGMINTPKGSGPRHLCYSADGRFLYVVLELSNEVAVYSWDEKNGEARLLQICSTLPSKVAQVVHTASEILISANGKTLWVANRGDDSIVRFNRDMQSGLLDDAEFFPCYGKIPRHFNVDPTGRWMAIANTDTNTVAICPIDTQKGTIFEVVYHVEVGKPMCVLFVPNPKKK